MERRLAAILAADVVGYSRLISQDEVGAAISAARWRVTPCTSPAGPPGSLSEVVRGEAQQPEGVSAQDRVADISAVASHQEHLR